MAWVTRFRSQYLKLRWSGGTFQIALCRACRFSTAQRCWHVSSHGRLRDSRGRLTFGALHSMGYRRVCIFGNFFLVHRVVALTFLGPPTEASAWQVHHQDGDGTNNRLENLAYVTPSENSMLFYGNNSSSTSKPVMWRNLVNPRVWNMCPSVAAAARELGVSKDRIEKCCCEDVQFGNYQLKFGPRTKPRPLKKPDSWAGEQWLPMRDPRTGRAVEGRQVSSFGRIRSTKRLATQGSQSRAGYFLARIHHLGCRVGVHRLVAYAFLGPPPSLQHTQVNHKDLNKGNNCVENLEYVTPSENMRHFHASVGYQGAKPGGKTPVLARPYGSEDGWIRFPSMLEASKVLGINRGSISKCTKGLVKRAGTREFCLAATDQPKMQKQFQGEEWRVVDLNALLHDKISRMA